MKTKTICKILRKKIDEWLASIKDEAVRKLLAENVIVTGGSIVSMLTQEQVSDYDVYFRTREAALAAANYYIKEFQRLNDICFAGDASTKVEIRIDESVADRVKLIIKSAGIASEGDEKNYQYFESVSDEQGEDYVERQTEALDETAATALEQDAEKEKREPYRPVFMTSNAITLSNKVQLVIRFYGEPDEIHKNYDFVHCTCLWTSWDGELSTPVEALRSIMSRELRYVGSKYPLCSIIRTRKFVARGWSINAGQFLKMAMQLNELDLTEVKVLEDQMVGVDAAYFQQVLARLREKDADRVDSSYLMNHHRPHILKS